VDFFQNFSDFEVLDFSEDLIGLWVSHVLIPIFTQLLCSLVLHNSDPRGGQQCFEMPRVLVDGLFLLCETLEMVKMQSDVLNGVPLPDNRLQGNLSQESLVGIEEYLLHLLNCLDGLKMSAELLLLGTLS
jgi:hypothetical protein